MEQNPRLGLLFFRPDSPLRSRGLGTATVSSRSRLGIVAALESITLLAYPRFTASSGLLSALLLAPLL